MNVLSSSWETERLMMRDANMGDVTHLRSVFNACAYMGEWDTTFYEETEEAFIQLVTKSLGLNHAAKEIFKMQCVTLRGSQNIIGYFHLFHNAPLPRKIWISMFVVHPHFQKMHYGSELAYGLWKQLKGLEEYESVWLKVCLKNWPALRFWIDMGWQTIIHYEGDTVHADDTNACLVLEKKLA